jgi:hypothetical protein
MAVRNPYFGEKSDSRLRIHVTDRYGTLDIDSATVTITRVDTGTLVRGPVACVVDSPYVYYVETFSTANGYAEGLNYCATFRVTMNNGGQVPATEVRFRVLPAMDQ